MCPSLTFHEHLQLIIQSVTDVCCDKISFDSFLLMTIPNFCIAECPKEYHTNYDTNATKRWQNSHILS